jgi:predicted RNA binding protein YcfA (HicA-like mRNA interferase family)
MIPEGPADVDTENVTVLVTKRALSVFCSVYPDTIQERAAEVDWDTFVSSMEDAGFRSKNGGGSIVIFEKSAGARKIIFHRPHPSPKIDAIMLQSIGRRMNKWFGWTRDTFTMAKKAVKTSA